MTLEEFKEQYTRAGVVDRNALVFLVEHAKNNDPLLIFFTEDESVGIKPIRK
jgi:hypothetical protein